MVQVTYRIDQQIARAGLIGNATTPNNIRSYSAEGAIPFGKAVVLGTDPERQATLPSAAGDDFVGILAHNHARESRALGTGEPQLEALNTADVMTFGEVWVVAGAAITAGQKLEVQASGAQAGELFPVGGATPALTTNPIVTALTDSQTIVIEDPVGGPQVTQTIVKVNIGQSN